MPPPQEIRNKALIRPYEGKPIIRPHFLGAGGIGKVPLDSHVFFKVLPRDS